MAGRASALLKEGFLKHKRVLFNIVLASILANILALGIALFSMQVYDRVIRNSGFQTLKVMTVGVLIAITLEILMRYLRSVLLDRECTRIDYELSEWFFRRAIGIRMETRPSTLGSFAAQIRNLDMIRGLLSSTPLFILVDLPFALLFILVIYFIGDSLVIVPIVMVPLTLVAAVMFRRIIGGDVQGNQELSNRKSGTLVESVGGIDSIKAFGAENLMIDRWCTLESALSKGEASIRYHGALTDNIVGSLQKVGKVVMLVYGAYLVVDGQMTMGGLIACKILSSRVMGPIGRLPSLQLQWAQAKSALERLDHLIALPNELDEASHQLTPGTLEGSIRLERVRFFYDKHARPAIDFSPVPPLNIAAGERVGVIGPVGSGKSTLLKIASGLWRPQDGQAFLGGVDMSMILPDTLRTFIAYVPQDIRLISGTLRDNLVFGMEDPGDDAILEAARETGLMDLIHSHSLGVALPISEGGSGISGGQKQLVALTRILLLRPSVLLLDEPTSSMDNETEARVVEILGKLVADGATLILSTHKSALLPMLDRLLVVNQGRLQMDGKRDAVLARLSGKPVAGQEAGI
jgi:ATP-binding cassette subfamily C protein LapB